MHDKRPDGAERLMLPAGEPIPNNPRLPVLLHRTALPAHGAAAAEAMFARHGWHPAWRNGVHAFHHDHPNAHEALAIAAGHVRVRLGGEQGVTLDLKAGDVVVLPAGTGHCNLGQSPDLLVVGTYPPGDLPEQFTGQPGEIARPARDPRHARPARRRTSREDSAARQAVPPCRATRRPITPLRRSARCAP